MTVQDPSNATSWFFTVEAAYNVKTNRKVKAPPNVSQQSPKDLNGAHIWLLVTSCTARNFLVFFEEVLYALYFTDFTIFTYVADLQT